MRRTNKRAIQNTIAYLMTILFLMALVAESSGGQTRQTQSAGNPLVKLGRFAPDFELPKLTLKTDDAGKPIGVISEKDTVRLSSFRGKKPVCLIMSSYT